jgi:hypothetical protein
LTRRRCLLLFSVLCVLLVSLCSGGASAFQSSGFTKEGEDWYDSWGIDRNWYSGPHGYLPDLASETLNENKELAYSIGEWFNDTYESKTARAEAILKYVQTWTEYGYDSDNVIRDGVAQEEWAWNADEMAHSFNETTGVKAIGDCEDLAFLCGTIYMGAGFDAAVVDAPDHVALLIWLPEYSNADNYWDIPDDGRGAGWIWVESTGSTNPLGWTPSDFDDGDWTAYPLGQLEPVAEESEPIPMDLIVLALVALVGLSIIAIGAGARKRSRPPPPPPFPF